MLTVRGRNFGTQNSTFVKGSRWTGRTHPQEKKERDMMLDNAILNNHTRTSITTGIVDVKVTVGSQDTQLFKEQNQRLVLKKRPSWEQLPKDLSGPDKKQVSQEGWMATSFFINVL